MGRIKLQSIQNTIISYAGVLIGYVNVVLLMPHFLEKNQVGLTRLLLTLAVVYAQFSAVGFANAGVKFFPYFRDKAQKHHSFLIFFLGVPFAGFLFITVLFLIFKDTILQYHSQKSPLILQYYYYILPLGFFTLLFNLLNAYLTSLYKTVVPSFAQDFLLRILTTLTVLGYAWNFYSFDIFLLLFVGINCGISLVLLIYTLWLKQFFLKPDLPALKNKPLKDMFRYGLYSYLGNTSGIVITSIDAIMLAHYNGLDEVGIYTTAMFIASVILIPGRSIYKIALPQIADFWKSQDRVGLANLYRQVTRLNMVIGCLLFVGIWANIDNMFALLPPEYASGKYVILLIGLARLFDVATGINGHILLTSPKYRWDLLFNVVLSLLTVGANIYFIPRFGITGAAFAAMVAYFIINLLRLFFVWQWFQMQPFDKTSLQIILTALLSYGAGYILPYILNTPLDLMVRSGVITLLYGIGVLYFNLAPELTQKIQVVLFKRKQNN